MSMTNDERARLMAILMLLAACDSGVGEASRIADQGVDDLPYLSRNGTRLPYIRYVDTLPNSGNGRIFFLHPMMDQRNELLALEGNPYGRISDLFAEDMIGISGVVSVEEQAIRIEFLPILIPIGVTSGQNWTMRYAEKDFICRSHEPGPEEAGSSSLRVSCSTQQYTLGFSFNRDRGVEEYQDFCGSSVCTFRLVDGDGLLSRDVLNNMGLPQI